VAFRVFCSTLLKAGSLQTAGILRAKDALQDDKHSDKGHVTSQHCGNLGKVEQSGTNSKATKGSQGKHMSTAADRPGHNRFSIRFRDSSGLGCTGRCVAPVLCYQAGKEAKLAPHARYLHRRSGAPQEIRR